MTTRPRKWFRWVLIALVCVIVLPLAYVLATPKHRKVTEQELREIIPASLQSRAVARKMPREAARLLEAACDLEGKPPVPFAGAPEIRAKLLALYRPNIELLERALKESGGVLKAPPLVTAQLEASSFSKLMQALRARTNHQIRAGDKDGAVSDYLLLVRLTAAFQQGGGEEFSELFLGGIGTPYVFFDLLLKRMNLTESELIRIDEALSQVGDGEGIYKRYMTNYFNDLVIVLRAPESQTLDKHLEALREGIEYPKEAKLDEGATIRLLANAFTADISALPHPFRLHPNRLMTMSDDFDKSYPVEAPEGEWSQRWYKFRISADSNSRGKMFIAQHASWPILQDLYFHRAALALMRTAIALKRYELRHKSFPKDILSLVTAGLLRRAPTDPHSGSQVLFDPISRKIWCVGENLVDDKGSSASGPNTYALDTVFEVP